MEPPCLFLEEAQDTHTHERERVRERDIGELGEGGGIEL